MGLGLMTEEFHPKRHIVSPGGRDRAGRLTVSPICFFFSATVGLYFGKRGGRVYETGEEKEEIRERQRKM